MFLLSITLLAATPMFADVQKALRNSTVAVRAKATVAAPSKPALTTLETFPPPKRRPRSPFHFGTYADGALLAVRARTTAARNMPRTWRRATPSQRVYIAFVRNDLRTADAVRRALERNGYSCFLYLPGRRNPAWANRAELGRYFREAETRLVIDSKAARSANGVQLKVHMQPREGKTCCKVCYYLNDLLAGCEPVTCGARCSG